MCLMWSIFDSAKLHSTLWSQMRVKVGTGLTVRERRHTRRGGEKRTGEEAEEERRGEEDGRGDRDRRGEDG